MYVVCALLRNPFTCLYGNQTSTFFELDPPSLQEYFVSIVHDSYKLTWVKEVGTVWSAFN